MQRNLILNFRSASFVIRHVGFWTCRQKPPTTPRRAPSSSFGSYPLLSSQNPCGDGRLPSELLLLLSLLSTRSSPFPNEVADVPRRRLNSHFVIAFLSAVSSLLESLWVRLSPRVLLVLDLYSDEDLRFREVLWGASVFVLVVKLCFLGPSGSVFARSREGRFVCPHTLPCYLACKPRYPQCP